MSNQLAKINIGKKQLAMDEETYRSMLKAQTGKSSLREMSPVEREKILHYMKSCGAKFTQTKKGKGTAPHNYATLPQCITKVEALLADMGLSWRYADSIARNITGGQGGGNQYAVGVERLAWVKSPYHWRGIITALVIEQEKRGLLDTVDRLLASINKDRAWCQGLEIKTGQRNWQRNRKTLNAIIVCLREHHHAIIK